MDSRNAHKADRKEPRITTVTKAVDPEGPVSKTARRDSKGGDGKTDSKSKGNNNSKGVKGRWIGKVTNWVSTSEPSLDALKRHRRETYQKAGISMDDPDANAKLHVPIGEIPPDAIKPAGRGPEPEEIARRRAEHRRRQMSQFLQADFDSRRSISSSSQSDQPYYYKPNETIFPYD